MRTIRYTAIVIILLGLTSTQGCKTPSQQTESPQMHFTGEDKQIRHARNIILLIGDGMGLPQITAGMYMQGNTTALEEFTVTGIQKTHSANNFISDSAAGATAFACGVKTVNGAVAMDPEGNPVATILEEAEGRGMATGMIVTSTIVHATPAAFVAHNTDRYAYEAIAADFVNAGVDLLIGGGERYFSRRSDDRNLLQEMQDNSYVVNSYTSGNLKDVKFPEGGKYMFLTADDDPLPVDGGRDYLIPATKKGLQFMQQLGKESGFFLMIEGSQIDWAGHDQDERYLLQEFFEFDKVVKYCLDFAKQEGNTLVVVTADHETGGLTLRHGNQMKSGKMEFDFSTDGHTAAMIPVFAYGPGAELFSGIYDNTAIHSKMRRALGFKDQDQDQ